MTLTQDYIKSVLKYCPETGMFKWTANRRGVVVGSECGRLSIHGYREIGLCGKLHRAHRLAFLYMTGSFPAKDIDHINRIRDDNRWENLRLCSDSENMQNTIKKPNNTSGKKGVTWDASRNKWRAQTRINGIKKNLGRYDSLDEAFNAVKAAHAGSGFYVA